MLTNRTATKLYGANNAADPVSPSALSSQPKEMKEPTGTQKMRGRPVTHEEARKSAIRLINSHFHNPDTARMSIPTEASDDDVTVMDYISEQSASVAHPSGDTKEELRQLLFRAAKELGYVHALHGTEYDASVVSEEGKDIIAESLILLGIPDLSEDELFSVAPSGAAEGAWIDVNKELPPFGEQILAYSPANKYQGMRYFVTALHVYSGKKEMIWLDEDINQWATHWSKLSAPPVAKPVAPALPDSAKEK